MFILRAEGNELLEYEVAEVFGGWVSHLKNQAEMARTKAENSSKDW